MRHRVHLGIFASLFLATEFRVDYSKQLAAWWAHEKERDFTKLECGLLGAYFSAIAIGFMVTLRVLLVR